VIAGIVLAAGKGTRLGGSKARLAIGGAPLACLHVRAFRAIGAWPVLVVRPEDAVCFAREAALVVTSEERDQAGSLARAVEALPREVVAALVTPVDLVPAAPATLVALRDALDATCDAVTPAYAGRRGHPVLVRRAVLEARARQPLREVLAALGPRRRVVEVDDPAVLGDLDLAADVLRVTGAPPRFV
jgi:CTP:molybdopterin cytidylyltransferase MocA